MNPETQKKLNFAANAAMAVVLFIAMIYLGVYGGSYLKERFASNDDNPQNNKMDESIAQARSIWGIGLVIFVILAILYLVSKITKKNN